MKHLAIKAFYTLILALLTGSAYGQSNLSACQGSDTASWDNCFGTENFSGGAKYVGEFKEGKRTGQGTITYVRGNKHMGEFKDGKVDGKGIFYTANGSIYESGIFKGGKLVTSQYIDPNSFKRIARNNSAPADSDSQRQEIEQERKSSGSTFGEIILKPNPNKLPLCSERLGTWQSPIKCWGEELRGAWNYVGEMKNVNVHGQGTPDGLGTWTDGFSLSYVGEFKAGKYHGQGILIFPNGSRQEGIWNDDQLVRKSKVNLPTLESKTANNSELGDLAAERQRLAEERRRLEDEKRQRELAKQNSRITISATATQPDANGVVTINIQTNTDTSSLKINGEELGGKADGSYSVKKVARVGQETKFTIVGIDINANTDTKTITVVRPSVDSKAVFGQLNAANVKQQPTRDAVAIIIGIEKYKRVTKADFANADAQVFYDYANRALGIKPENIKLLVDDGADDVEIYRAFQNWLPLKVKKGKTEVFVFFSGHGLPSQDGKSLYLLPWGVDKDFIEKTAINQQEIIASLQAVQPKSVTMFIDSCYSGQARGGETLLASARPIALKAEASAYPPNFTVISASAPDQLSSSSPDLKHGIFSYYLMKGMEGDADQNKDGKITVAEIQEYLTDMVGRQAMGMNRKQQPQLFGDADRVLVGR